MPSSDKPKPQMYDAAKFVGFAGKGAQPYVPLWNKKGQNAACDPQEWENSGGASSSAEASHRILVKVEDLSGSERDAFERREDIDREEAEEYQQGLQQPVAQGNRHYGRYQVAGSERYNIPYWCNRNFQGDQGDDIDHVLRMDPNLARPLDPEFESQLAAFDSYNGKADHEHLFWIPHELAVYSLQVAPDLRKIYKASFEEFKYKEDEYVVRLFNMRERNYKGTEFKLIWIGIILHPPEEVNGIDLTGFQGTTLSCAMQLAAHPDVTMVRGPRNREIDKVQPNEIYYGWWPKALEYTLMQTFGNRRSECQTSVITVIAVEADSIRIARQRKNSRGKLMDVMLGMDALPKAILLRPDDEKCTLRRQDRCMNDYGQEGVDRITSKHQEQSRKVPAPWRPVVPERPMDLELVQNAESMAKYQKKFGDAPGVFPNYTGLPGQTNEEQRRAIRLEESEAEPALASGDWPQSSGPIRPTWWYRLWEVEKQGEELQSIKVPTRTEVEIAAATRYKQQIVSKGINPALREALQQCRRGELSPKDARWKNFDLHEISNAVRHGGPSMHITIAKTMHDGFGNTRRRIPKALKGQTFSADVLAEKYTELHELETMQAHCKDVIYDASNFEDYDWKDPVWLGHLRIGHSEGIANK